MKILLGILIIVNIYASTLNEKIIEMEERHEKILKLGHSIDESIKKFNEIYKKTKKLISNKECEKLKLAIEYLNNEITTLGNENKDKEIVFNKSLIDEIKLKQYNLCEKKQ